MKLLEGIHYRIKMLEDGLTVLRANEGTASVIWDMEQRLDELLSLQLWAKENKHEEV